MDINPLVACAASLFTVASQLAVMGIHADIPGLRRQIENEIRRFDMAARERGLSPEYIIEARYALCSLMDEVVLNTPWGSQSNWTAETLLSTFHQETWGGDKFFEILNRRLQEPARALDVIEFLYLCISLGFIGKYRIRQGGIAELEMLRQDVYSVIQRQRGPIRFELSPHWASSVRKQSVLRNGIPLWAIGAVASALLLVSYIGFSVAISGVGDLVMNQAETLIRDPEPTKVAHPPPPAPPLDVCGLFENEVKGRIIEVSNEAGGCLIRLVTSGLFASGSDRVNSEFLPLLARMAEELGKLNNTVRVVGHTDKVPIVTARFQSNWALSQARAKSVAAELGRGRPNGANIETEGKADTNPLVADEKTPEDRARNRRVEIFVLN